MIVVNLSGSETLMFYFIFVRVCSLLPSIIFLGYTDIQSFQQFWTIKLFLPLGFSNNTYNVAIKVTLAVLVHLTVLAIDMFVCNLYHLIL